MRFNSGIEPPVYYQITPEWLNRYLASSVHYLRGTAAKDNQLVQRTRTALGG